MSELLTEKDTQDPQPSNILEFPFKSNIALSRNLFEVLQSQGLKQSIIIGFDPNGSIQVLADAVPIDRALYLLEVAKLKLLGVTP